MLEPYGSKFKELLIVTVHPKVPMNPLGIPKVVCSLPDENSLAFSHTTPLSKFLPCPALRFNLRHQLSLLIRTELRMLPKDRKLWPI
jgi:hypothetical protein